MSAAMLGDGRTNLRIRRPPPLTRSATTIAEAVGR
jgi:hypothetical protein